MTKLTMKSTMPSALAVLLTLMGPAVLSGFEAWSGVTADRKILTLEGARKVADAAEAEARKRSAGGAIAVVDAGGHLILLVRIDGTFPAAATVATDKARTAATFERETKIFEDAVAKGRTSLVAVKPMTPLEGGVPIVAGGQVVGAIGVSGAHSADEDQEIASAAAQVLK